MQTFVKLLSLSSTMIHLPSLLQWLCVSRPAKVLLQTLTDSLSSRLKPLNFHLCSIQVLLGLPSLSGSSPSLSGGRAEQSGALGSARRGNHFRIRIDFSQRGRSGGEYSDQESFQQEKCSEVDILTIPGDYGRRSFKQRASVTICG